MSSNIQHNTEKTLVSNNIEDSLDRYNKLYWIFSLLVGIILFIQQFRLQGAVIGAVIGLILAFFIIQAIALIKLIKLNFKKYSLSCTITEEQLYQYLQTSFSHPDIKINKGLTGVKFIFRDSTSHTVSIDEKKKTFSINSCMTIKARLKRGGKSNSVTEYKNAVAIIPLVKKAVEEAAVAVSQ